MIVLFLHPSPLLGSPPRRDTVTPMRELTLVRGLISIRSQSSITQLHTAMYELHLTNWKVSLHVLASEKK